MKLIKTKDSSYTFLNEELNETYHSISGAIEESFEKFVKPCSNFKNPKILDICFGIGYNSCAALDYFDNCSIVAIEKDEEILDKIKSLNPDFKNYETIKKVSRELEYKNIILLIGDARVIIKNLSNEFDIVFLDPFSPKKCPELWTLEFFEEIHKIMKEDSILTTYSCAKQIRNNLKEVGFIVKDGPSIGRRSPSTIAIKCNSA